MKRAELASVIAQRLGPKHVVICGMGATMFAWESVGAATPTYYSSDPMGLAPGMALGFAIACPDVEVVLLGGDGDLSMNLSVLLAWADAAPPNLRMIVFHSRRYETGGGQRIPGAQQMNLGITASSLGVTSAAAVAVDESERTPAAVEEILRAPGPAVLVVELETEAAPYPDSQDESGVEARAEFQRRLKICRAMAADAN